MVASPVPGEGSGGRVDELPRRPVDKLISVEKVASPATKDGPFLWGIWPAWRGAGSDTCSDPGTRTPGTCSPPC